MNRLILLLFKYRTFIVFIFLESLCALLIINNNSFQRAAFFTNVKEVTNSFYATRSSVLDYFSLTKINEDLINENARLRLEISKYKAQDIIEQHIKEIPDSTGIEFISAQVVNNEINKLTNHITINKGSNQGVRPNMGVFGKQGVVGKVKYVSDNFATIYSLLHIEYLVSSKLYKDNTLCSVNWDANDSRYAQLRYVPKHVQINIGDTVVTSGFNSIFQEGILIGTVEKVETPSNTLFHEINLKLSTNFRNLSHVYVISDNGKNEKDSLQNMSEKKLNL